jgi:chlorobactene glucosyltransferase
MTIILSLSTLIFVIGLAVTCWLHSQHHLDVVVKPEKEILREAPLVSIIIPARNEARNIQRCVQGALSQTYPDLEVIVVDDRSTDATPRILAEIAGQHEQNRSKQGAVLKVVQGKDLPLGWAGKPHALAQGAAQAQGDWLCFLDSDTFAAPELVSAAFVTAAEHQADLFTILTNQELGSFWEKAIQPLVFTALAVGFSPRLVNDPRRPEAVANGQFILIRRAVYDAVGGHAAVWDQIVEDKVLAERVKRSGYRLVVGDGRAVARTRMYTRFSEIWEGWTKNIYLGMRDRLGLLLVGAVVGLVGALILPTWLAGGLLWFMFSGQVGAAVVALQGLLLWAVLLYARIQVSRSFDISPWYALTLPLGAAVFTGMMFASAYKVISGQGVTWKGRKYPR